MTARDAIAEIVSSDNALLVLGAGASATSGAPLASGLVEQLRAEFPIAGIAVDAQLFDACRDIEDTPAYSRQDLHRFVHRKLIGLEPSDSYKQLPRTRWRAIFTTNYDDLVEKVYSGPGHVQTLQPVPAQYRGALIARDNHLQLHYLMGSAKEPLDSPAGPVLTWSDYTRSLRTRAPVMDLFRNVLADGGKVLYLGYSFNDLVFEGILDEAMDRLGVRGMPYGHAILPEWPSDARRGYHRMAARKVVPVEGTFEDFADLLRELANNPTERTGVVHEPPASPASGVTITIGNRKARLSESEAGVYSEAFELLTDNITVSRKASPAERSALARAMFRGEEVGWATFELGIPFRRPMLDGVVRSAVEVATREARRDRILLIHGPAAVGKSIIARQLAYELFTRYGMVVAIAKPSWRSRPDLKLLDRLFDDLEGSLDEGETLPPVVVIVDEAELLDSSLPQRITSYLAARHRNCVLVLVARTNEYFRVALKSNEDALDAFELCPISDTIAREEVRGLIAHLQAVGLWDSRRIATVGFWQDHVEKQWNSSFFETVYSLIEDTQKPLTEQVWSEFERLSPVAQDAYLLIASVYQFGLSLKMEMLMRALDVEFATFEEQVIRSDAREVLFREHSSSELNLYFRARSRLICQKVFDRALPTAGAQLPWFVRVVGAMNPSDMFGVDELDTVRTLLIHVLGPSGYDSRFAPPELSELFSAATKVAQDDVLEHHFGIVEREAGRLISARAHLERALELSALLPYDLASYRESPQNIENSLAIVIGSLALEAVSRNDYARADELFEDARSHFVRARAGAFPNAAAYDAHARMLLARARRLFAPGSSERTLALAEVIEVTSEGADNVNADHRADLIAIQTEVLDELGSGSAARTDLVRRAENAQPRERARYEVLLARLVIKGAAADSKRKHLRTAYAHAVLACESDPDLFSAWKIRSEIHAVLHPADRAERIEYLELALRCPDARDNVWVLFELAVALFDEKRYSRCVTTFAKLRSATRGHHNGSVVVERAGERGGGEPYEFEGRVTRSEQRGTFLVRSDEIAEFGEIFFNARAERFYSARVGDLVSFVVGFTYRGIVAVDVKRL